MEVGGNESKVFAPGETGTGIPMIRFPKCVRDAGVPGKAVAFSRAEIRGNEPERPDVVAVRESRSPFRGTAQHPDTIGVQPFAECLAGIAGVFYAIGGALETGGMPRGVMLGDASDDAVCIDAHVRARARFFLSEPAGNIFRSL